MTSSNFESIKITETWAGVRIDRLLKKIYNFDFAKIQKILREKKILVNKAKTTGNYRLQIDDEITFDAYFTNNTPNIFDSKNKTQQTATERNQKDKKLATLYQEFLQSIIYQDDDIIAIDKKQGFSVQGGTNVKYSVDDILSYRNKLAHNISVDAGRQKSIDLHLENLADRWQLVHRLDKETSGILLIAKNRHGAEKLSDGFRNKTITKTYLAVVSGEVKKHFFEVNLPLRKTMINNQEKMLIDRDGGKDAISKIFLICSKDNLSLMALQPITGRTHQLRVHCLAVGHPILNDKKYNLDKDSKIVNNKVVSAKMCLNAHAIVIKDYKDREDLQITNPNLPEFANLFLPKAQLQERLKNVINSKIEE